MRFCEAKVKSRGSQKISAASGDKYDGWLCEEWGEAQTHLM